MSVSTGIRVDLTALTKVLTDLRRDVDRGMTPSTNGAAGELGDTARFGSASASGEVIAGATDVSYAASIAAHNVGVHIDNAYAIAALIEGAVAGYRLADGLALQEFSSLSSAGTPSGSPPDGGASGASGDGLTPVFVGPLPAPKIPIQALTQSPHALNWDAYDTPRLWSMVSHEVSDAAWGQMHAFRRLSDALNDQHRRMLALRARLVEAWSPQGAGAQVLAAWDKHTAALESDAMCAYLTSKALGNILQTLSDARGKIAKLNETWNHVTTDFNPEWWDHAAELTNEKARRISVEAEKAVADYRRHIAVPRPAGGLRDVVTDESGSDQGEQPGRTPAGGRGTQGTGESGGGPLSEPPRATGRSPQVPPPLPGTVPTVDGPSLAGWPLPVAISQSTPPSTLPIPPGINSVPPAGGAYVLPNRWLPGGGVIPMSAPAAVTASRVMPLAGSGQTQTGHGLFGMPGYSGAGRPSDHSAVHRGPTEQWEVAVGVPPVIEPPVPLESETGESEIDEEMERFREWYKDVATPWAPDVLHLFREAKNSE